MLSELRVCNFAIIDNIHIQFRPGLNILSGETGAGKSILLKSLGLLIGEKALAEVVRDGAENALVEGGFDLSQRPDILDKLQEMGIECPDSMMVVRRVVAKDKSRVYINGSLSTLTSLRDLVSPLVEVAGHVVPLIEMTGQHENRNLLSRAYHLDLLDQFAGTWKKRQLFATRFSEWNQLQVEIQRVRTESRNRAQRLDFLKYQAEEINALDLQPGEEVIIEGETRRLKHVSKLSEFAALAEATIEGDEDSLISRVQVLLNRAADLRSADPELERKLDALRQAKALIEDAGFEMREYAKNLDSDPGRLDALQARLSSLRQLQKKYGNSSEEILRAAQAIENEITELENSDELLGEMETRVVSLRQELDNLAEELHKTRKAAAKGLSERINAELKDLNMKGVLFSVSIEKAAELAATGASSVEFMTRSSASDSPRSLAKYASGGELSRVLLSIKQVVGAGPFPRTFLFDEVDAGVSGPTAEKVGRKLKRIASGQQVICVTHLPQVASYGDIHFFIHKSTSKNSLQTEVEELRKKERVREIARLISGEKITKTSLAHAEQLLRDGSP